MKKLILGVTIGGSSRLLDNQAAYFRSLGYDVYLMSQKHHKEELFCKREGITHLPLTIDSEINPIKDIFTIIQIIRHFRAVRPDIINVGTPKVGLLGMIVGSLMGVKKRIYTCRGLRFETETGIKRKILILMEKWTMQMAHKVIYVSPSLLKAASSYGIADMKKAIVIGFGSSNGVNITDFDRAKIDSQKVAALKHQYDLEDKKVIGFVGRITEHKGSFELVQAFENIYQKHPDTRLILMGHIKTDPVFEARFKNHPGIVAIPFNDDVPLHMALFDIFVLPSWREGFPNVTIQAAAMGIPVVVSDATGCVDSVNNNVNGGIFPMKDSDALEIILLRYVEDKNLRKKHGEQGIEWAQHFKNEFIWQGINNVYNS